MTTPNQHTGSIDEISTPPARQVGEFDSAPVDPVNEQAEYPSTAAEPVQPEVAQTATANPDTANPNTMSQDALFAESDLSELRARWNDVQATFVDDPKDCVQKADGLVSDAVEQLTTSFSHARSRLEEQWARGEEASTEDLRLALKRYREFFERLLAV
ncbi:hypothetical protein BH09ACT7_BH09ACT7_30500 [soil metagenome]